MLGLGLRLGAAFEFASGGESWSPAIYFEQNEQGAWLESKAAYTTQDEAGTVPVTNPNDPVARFTDRSGNGNHATTGVDTQRMVYRSEGIVERDGVDDYLSMPSLPWGNVSLVADASSSWTLVWAGTVTSGSLGFAVEEDNTSRIIRLGDLVGEVSLYLRGSSTLTGLNWADATKPVVVSVTWDGTTANMVVTLNDNESSFSPAVGTHTVVGNENPTIGARDAAGGSLHSAGDFTGLFIREGVLPTEDLSQLRSYFNTLTL